MILDKKIKISVILPVYNEEKNIIKCVNSILSQSLKNFELIIINDGSTDSTHNKLIDLINNDKRIIYIKQNNKGLSKSLNTAISKCKGEYIARIDADDISNKDRLKIQSIFLDKNKGIDIVVSNALIKKNILFYKTKMPIEKDLCKTHLLFSNPFIHSSIMFKASCVESYFFYKENIEYGEDYELWARLSDKYNIVNIPNVLISYNTGNFQMSSVVNTKLRYKCIKKIQRDYLNKFNYKFSEEEIEIHFSISSIPWHFKSNLLGINLNYYYQWLEKIQNINDSKKIFKDHFLLDTIIYYQKLIAICNFDCGLKNYSAFITNFKSQKKLISLDIIFIYIFSLLRIKNKFLKKIIWLLIK